MTESRTGRTPITEQMQLDALRQLAWQYEPVRRHYNVPYPPDVERVLFPWRYPDPNPFPRLVLFSGARMAGRIVGFIVGAVLGWFVPRLLVDLIP